MTLAPNIRTGLFERVYRLCETVRILGIRLSQLSRLSTLLALRTRRPSDGRSAGHWRLSLAMRTLVLQVMEAVYSPRIYRATLQATYHNLARRPAKSASCFWGCEGFAVFIHDCVARFIPAVQGVLTLLSA